MIAQVWPSESRREAGHIGTARAEERVRAW